MFVDKKQLLRNSLAKIMVGELQALDGYVQKNPEPEITIKADGSPVTKLDLLLSAHVESLMEEHFPGVNFYSEEKFSELTFPLLALDPLDGTREYIAKRPEWAISIGLFENKNFEGEGWIYNPMTKECFTHPKKISFEDKETFRGEVSHSEWKEGLFTNKSSEKFLISPMGSIAYKLGRLAFQKSDFVVSLRPKNIWDIAGGTLLCKEAGMKFYSQGEEVREVKELYLPPLIWCHEEIFSELSEIFPPTGKHL